MEIYIIRDGKQIGPFSKETTQRLLTQGSVLPRDLAWRAGMSQWIPLEAVLIPAAPQHTRGMAPVKPPVSPPGARDGSPPAPAISPPAPQPPVSISAAAESALPVSATIAPEAATARQIAFLKYMGLEVPAELSRAQAVLMVNETMENPKDAGRLGRWSEERLRLHPDLYAVELQAKKENRPNRFFEMAENEGAECFHGLAKAHCQVLSGYLDVKFPNWDADEKEGAWSYFFPAIAEKFPDLVTKEWRGKLKYPSGPKVSTELKRRTGPTRIQPSRTSPVAALLQGLAIGAAVLAIVVGGIFVIRQLRARSGSTEIRTSSESATPARAPQQLAPAATTQDFSSAKVVSSPAERDANPNEGDIPAPDTAPNAAGEPMVAGDPPLSPEGSPPMQAESASPLRSGSTSDTTKENPSMKGFAPAPPASSEKETPGAFPVDSLFGPASDTKVSGKPPKEKSPAPVKSIAPGGAAAAGSSLDALFGAPVATGEPPDPAASPTAMPVLAGAGAPATTQRKTTVLVTKPVEVPVRFGTTKLPVGAQLKVIAQEGAVLKVSYLGAVVTIPASSTDFGSGAP